MQDSSWSRFESYSLDELEQLLERLERCAAHSYRQGDHKLGHEDYLLACECMMVVTIREAERRSAQPWKRNPLITQSHAPTDAETDMTSVGYTTQLP